jgi:hypothetical protein
MKLILTDQSGAGREYLQGFRYFWLKYVSGFDQAQHCARCLLGNYSKLVNTAMLTERIVQLQEPAAAAPFDYLYLCGVAAPYQWERNFHLALRPAAPETITEAETSNGFRVSVQGLEAVPIPTLPDGFQGLAKAYTTCRNFQFGVASYGWQEK